MISNLTIDEIEYVNLILKANNYQIIKKDEYDNSIFDKYVVYKEDNIIKGFLNYALIYDRIEINFIVVDSRYRNQKIASNLIEYLIEKAIKNNCENISLEVNKNNENALKLYNKYGFKRVGIRSSYYDGVDALLMVRELR